MFPFFSMKAIKESSNQEVRKVLTYGFHDSKSFKTCQAGTSSFTLLKIDLVQLQDMDIFQQFSVLRVQILYSDHPYES